MSPSTQQKYHPVEQGGSSSVESQSCCSEDDGHYYQEKAPSSCRTLSATRNNILLFISASVNIVLLAVLSLFLWTSFPKGRAQELLYRNPDINQAIKATSSYSPILDEVDLNLSPKRINGSLFALDDPSYIYRMDPSPEVDAAWDRLSGEGYEIIMISGADLPALHKDPSTLVRAPESWGYGPSAYPVQIDVFHQIHCLNELRKEIHADYYYRGNEQLRPLHRPHKKHCLHVLLQNLMCRADVGVITHDWVEGVDRPFADFGVEKQCGDFEGLLEWTRGRALGDVKGRFDGMSVPEGVRRKSVPRPLGMYNGTA